MFCTWGVNMSFECWGEFVRKRLSNFADRGWVTPSHLSPCPLTPECVLTNERPESGHLTNERPESGHLTNERPESGHLTNERLAWSDPRSSLQFLLSPAHCLIVSRLFPPDVNELLANERQELAVTGQWEASKYQLVVSQIFPWFLLCFSWLIMNSSNWELPS